MERTKKGHPRLQGAVSLHKRSRYVGLYGNLGPERNHDVKGASDPKSEGGETTFKENPIRRPSKMFYYG